MSTLFAVALAGALVAAGVAFAVVPSPNAGAPATAPASGPARPEHHAAGAHDWRGGEGTIPDLATALTTLDRRSTIVIGNDSQFNPANGVRSGSGTYDDPFVIQGWYVDTILVHDTTKAFEIKENYVSSILIVDWTGAGGYVHHNHLENLRTNRNVARTGDPSATVIENNLILRVEQLRHFDGEVRNNTIGRAPLVTGLPTTLPGKDDVVFDIAGLNGAGIHDNAIYGGVDMKIHGHHHGDHAGGASHNHGTPRSAGEGADARSALSADEATQEMEREDHQVRYVDFEFYGNRIVDDGFGLRYNDLNHAGDDRTATSEKEPDLEKPHVHHTRIHLHDNVIDGATLRVAVVNAEDERHLPGEEAELVLENNTVANARVGNGIQVQAVQDATVRIVGNHLQRGDSLLPGSCAILLSGFRNSTILVGENALGAWKYGVCASHLDATTRWAVHDNDASGVKQPVYWDSTVANPPEGEEAPEEEHDHGHEAWATDALTALRPG